MPKKLTTPENAPQTLAPQTLAPHTYAPRDVRKPIHMPFGATRPDGLRPNGLGPENPAHRVSQGDLAFASAPAFLTGLTALFGAITQKRGA